MDETRRKLLQASSLASFLPIVGLASAVEKLQTPSSTPEKFNQQVFDFWTSKIRSPYDDFVKGEQSKGVQIPQPEDSTFVALAPNRGLVPATVLQPSDFQDYPESGNMDIEFHVEKFRPSQEAKAAYQTMQTGTLRVDVKQVKPLIGLPEALAWTAMTTLASRTKNKTPPALDSSISNFDPGTAWGQFQTIPLTDGLGFWSWNFFLKKRQGFWGTLLDELFKILDTTQPILPLLGIPGIAVSGLKYVDQIIGAIHAQGDSQWLFKGLDIAVCATKQSFKDAGGTAANKVLLADQTTYVIMPESAVGSVDSSWVVSGGLIVPAGTKDNQLFSAAAQILPHVSYMTISVHVSASKTKAGSTSNNPANPSATKPGSSPSNGETKKPDTSAKPKP
jgi:hypothetical protein